MQRVLPPSLTVTRVRLVPDDFPKVGAALRQAEYLMTLRGGEAQQIAQAVEGFLAQEEIMALRKSKRGEAMVNIRPMLHELTVLPAEGEETVRLRARVSFVEQATLKPDLLLASLAEFAGVALPPHDIRRTRLLGEKDGVSTPLIDL